MLKIFLTSENHTYTLLTLHSTFYTSRIQLDDPQQDHPFKHMLKQQDSDTLPCAFHTQHETLYTLNATLHVSHSSHAHSDKTLHTLELTLHTFDSALHTGHARRSQRPQCSPHFRRLDTLEILHTLRTLHSILYSLYSYTLYTLNTLYTPILSIL